MHACHNKKMPEKASEKPDFASAWLNASIEVDNANAIAELAWQSMSDNSWSEFVPEGMVATVARWDFTHRCALDTIKSLLENVSEFFDGNEVAAREASGRTVKAAKSYADSHDEMQLLIDQWHEHREQYDRLAASQVSSDEDRDMEGLLKACWSVEERALGEVDPGQGRYYFAIIQSLKGLANG